MNILFVMVLSLLVAANLYFVIAQAAWWPLNLFAAIYCFVTLIHLVTSGG